MKVICIVFLNILSQIPLSLEEYRIPCSERARLLETCKELTPSIENQIVDELNRKLAIVHTATTHILIEKCPPEFVLDSKASLLTLYENDLVEIDGKL
jgi:hypothetical protein